MNVTQAMQIMFEDLSKASSAKLSGQRLLVIAHLCRLVEVGNRTIVAVRKDVEDLDDV